VWVLRCQLLGHRYRFRSDGPTMRWDCERGCGAGGSKRYPSSSDADRYAAAFDRDSGKQVGRRAPLGLFPLRLVHAVRSRWRRD
jgi:hypothetical protein